MREIKNRIEILPEEPCAVALSTFKEIIRKVRPKGTRHGIQQRREEIIRPFALNPIRETDLSDEQSVEVVDAETTYVTKPCRKASESIL